jgi:hypothetical protein
MSHAKFVRRVMILGGFDDEPAAEHAVSATLRT